MPMMDGMNGMTNGMMGGMMWMGVLWLVFGVLLLVLLVVGIVWLVRHLSNGGSAWEDRGVEVLRERFARGEIDEQEYRSRKQELQS